jgi:hypothetical protein
MSFFNPKAWGTAFGAAALATMAFLPAAKGELVYEDEAAVAAPASAAVRGEDRENLRQALRSSEKQQATIQAAPAAQTTIIEQPAPYVAVGPAAEIQNLSKSELMRRERVRAEVKNEDILQERLEELRLRDERKRTESLIAAPGAPLAAAAAPAPAAAPLHEEVIGAAAATPVAAAAASPAASAAAAAPAGTTVAVVQSETNTTTSVSTTSLANLPSDSEDKTLISVQPRIGVGSMNDANGYNLKSRVAGGFSLNAEVSNNLTFEAGYTYSEYGVNMASTNPFVANVQAWNAMYGQQNNLNTLVMKQNVIDLGLRLYLLGRPSRFRPFIGGGGGYSKSYVNYDQSILNSMRTAGYQNVMGQDYELSSYLGYVAGGFDIALTKSVSISALFKYYSVLSSNENQQFNNGAFYNGAYPAYGYSGLGVGNYYANIANTDKQIVGGSLAGSSFYTAMAGVSFTF